MSTDEAGQVARLLAGTVLPDLRRQGSPYVPTIHRAARLLLEMHPGASMATPDRCRGCGVELDRQPRGRPRKWCEDACRSRFRRR